MKKILFKISIFLLILFSISLYSFVSYFPTRSIVVELVGGLGNQLFQYASAYSLSQKTNSKLIMLVENHQGDAEYSRRLVPSNDYALGQFSIPQKNIIYKNSITKAYINMALYLSSNDGLSFVYNEKTPKIKQLIADLFNIELADKMNFFKLSKQQNNKRILMRDYFTSDIYFKDIKDDLFEQLTLPKLNSNKMQNLINKVSNEDSVCLHLRRGDMVKAGVFIPHYEKKAINLIKTLIDKPRFFIFSDDIDGVKQQVSDFQISNPYFVSDFTTLEDFKIMSKCSNVITGLSTFSWWAAYLNQNNRVIAPYDFKTFFPENSTPKNWTLLNYNIQEQQQ